jgi:hypothetical protein
MVGQRATQSDNLFKDCKAQIVGRSWCKLVHQMEQWAATADDDWQQGKGTSITPTHGNSTLASSMLPSPLLDGRQGKTASAHQHFEDCYATGWDTDKGIQTRATVTGQACPTMMGGEQQGQVNTGRGSPTHPLKGSNPPKQYIPLNQLCLPPPR